METRTSDEEQRTIEQVLEQRDPINPRSAAPEPSYGIAGLAVALLSAAIGLLLYL